MGSKTRTRTAQSTTPTVAQPYSGAFQDYTGMIGDFLDQDSTQFVAPPSDLQSQAFSDVGGLGDWRSYLDQASDYTNQFASNPTTQIDATGYDAPQLGDAYQFGGADLGDAYGFDGAQLGQANQVQAARLGSAPQVSLGGYNVPQLGNAAMMDPARLKEYMADYQNPYGQQVIDATMADFDHNAGRQRAALAAEGANRDAFGGSRWGIREGALEGELARGRASTQAALRDQQFRLSAELGGQDMNAEMQANMANQGARNQFGLARFGAGIDQARYGADSANQAAMANRDASMQYGMQQGAFDQQANMANQEAVNNFMIQQGMIDQQTGQINMEALNSFAMQQGLFDQQTGQVNMEAMNRFLTTQLGLDADSARYYADATNQATQTNANLMEQSYLREMQAAGMFGQLGQQYGQQDIADLGMTADLGTMQRSLESEYLNAYPTQLQLAGNLYSQLYPGLYSGQNMTGTNTSKTGGLGTWLPQLAGSAMQAAATFSDRRLKTNIKLVRRDPDGLGWYDWNWKSAPNGPTAHGVLADEVKVLRPQAYVENFRDGYDGVNYAKLGAE